MESWCRKDLSKKENQHNEWRGKMLRDMSNKSKKFEHKSKESLEEKKSSISKKILQNSSKTDTQANECSSNT